MNNNQSGVPCFLIMAAFCFGYITGKDWPSEVEVKPQTEHTLLCIQMYKIQSKHNYVLECSGVLK